MSLRFVKGLVIAMSAALVVGFIVLMVGLAHRAIELGRAEDAPAFRAQLDLPDGAAIAAISGAGDHLAVLVELPGGSHEIHVVDPETGQVHGVVAAD